MGGVGFDPLTEPEVVAHVAAAWERGEGGVIVTPNVDIVRQAARSPYAARLVAGASLVLADGMPLIWASRLARRGARASGGAGGPAGRGRGLPARVAGSDLIWSLCASAAGHGRSVYLLGGAPGVPERAAEVLAARYPGLTVAGTDSPPYGFDEAAGGVTAVTAAVKAAKPDLVFVGLGFPRQERLIASLAAELPTSWFVGCGASIAFAAGAVPRAPRWMRRTGLEWLHRLAAEPRRLFRRYILQDAPYALRLLGQALVRRWTPTCGRLGSGRPAPHSARHVRRRGADAAAAAPTHVPPSDRARDR